MYSILRQFQNNLLVGSISPQFLKNYRSPEIGIPYNGHLQTIILFAEFFLSPKQHEQHYTYLKLFKTKTYSNPAGNNISKTEKSYILFYPVQSIAFCSAMQWYIYIDLKKFINVLKHPRLGFGTDKLQGCDVKRGLRSHQRWARELVEERVTQTEISVILPVSH